MPDKEQIDSIVLVIGLVCILVFLVWQIIYSVRECKRPHSERRGGTKDRRVP